MIISVLLAATLQTPSFRPPAVPLVTHDPYFSIWAETDRANGGVTRHWTHAPNPIRVSANVDGVDYLLVGNPTPANSDTIGETQAIQLGCKVTPTRTLYDFRCGQVDVTLEFMDPILPSNLDALTRPATYVTWTAKSEDGRTHRISPEISLSGLLSAPAQAPVVASAETFPGLAAVRVGSKAQDLLSTPGDGTRIDWGFAYLSGPVGEGWSVGKMPAADPSSPENAGEIKISISAPSANFDARGVNRHCEVAYDELYEIDYFGRRLRPYWRRHGAGPEEMLEDAEHDYRGLQKACTNFDANLTRDLTRVGGAKYAQICSLAYRQAFAACGIAADADGQPLMFTKENTSNGDIATVDVIFPMDPMLVLLSPALAKATLVPDLDYASSSHWRFPNAPHDLGTYPIAGGTDDGGEGMPVEESGNMLILCDAIAQAEGDGRWVDKWWPKLGQWEHYLEQYGLDPEDQLCTDDFMGHLAHNANLSIKAILGIAAYGDLCRLRGDGAEATRIHELAKTDAAHFMRVASDGDHTRLAFDKPNTWSQKYNLVWDQILHLSIFPPSLAEEEVAFYKEKLQPYGVPLDSRTKLTKTDWSVWSASMAKNRSDFETLIAPIYRYMDTTTNRQPMVDSYVTNEIGSNGMHARPVVGGVFIRALTDRSTWLSWAHRGDQKVGPWAAFPKPPIVTEVVPTSQNSPQLWRMTLTRPASGWQEPGFDDSAWTSAKGPFGSAGTPGITPTTQWTTDDIWLRREVTLPDRPMQSLKLLVYHDEDVQIFVNGILAGRLAGYRNAYLPLDIRPEAARLLKPGARVVLAVHCHQTEGGQGVDVGLADVREP